MTPRSQHAELHSDRPTRLPAEDLARQVRDVLEHAVRRLPQEAQGLREPPEPDTRWSARSTGIGSLYELIQNAHDAHRADDRGRIALQLVVRSETDATLYVANSGTGFRPEDVDAIKNLATTAKEIGESIGNKGLGFRSIEALTDDVRIFSRRDRDDSDRFDGYCFRFATENEIRDRLAHGRCGRQHGT